MVISIMIKRFLFILVFAIFFAAIPCVADVANDENVMSKDVDISSKVVRKVRTAGLTKDMSVEKKKKKLAKFCVKYDNSAYESYKDYREKFVDKIDWTKVEADLPIEFYELFDKRFHSLPSKYVTDKTSLIKIQEFVEYMSDLEINYSRYTIERIIDEIAWENVSDNGVSDTLKIFIKNEWINLIPDPKYYTDEQALIKIKDYVEKRGNTKYISYKISQSIIDGSIPEKYAYAWDNGYLDYTNGLSYLSTYNQYHLENLILVIDKMKSLKYSFDEIKELFEYSKLEKFKVADISALLAFIEKEYAMDWLDYYYSIEDKLALIDEMYQNGCSRKAIKYFLEYDFKMNVSSAITIIASMQKNGYTLNDISLLIKAINWNSTVEIPQEFYIAVNKGIVINTLDPKELEYFIKADEDATVILNQFVRNKFKLSQLNQDALKFIENKDKASELKKLYSQKDLDNDIVVSVLNSADIKENRKVSSIKKLQAVKKHNTDHAENLRTAGMIAVFSMYGGIAIAVTWPLCATFAVTSAIIDKPRQLYYIPRYIQAKKLDLEIKKVTLLPLNL